MIRELKSQYVSATFRLKDYTSGLYLWITGNVTDSIKFRVLICMTPSRKYSEQRTGDNVRTMSTVPRHKLDTMRLYRVLIL